MDGTLPHSVFKNLEPVDIKKSFEHYLNILHKFLKLEGCVIFKDAVHVQARLWLSKLGVDTIIGWA